VILEDADEMETLVSNIQISRVTDEACECGGQAIFEFYRDDIEDPVVCLTIHQGTGLRWYGGPWEGDAQLMGVSTSFLLRWLDEHGISRPKEEYEEQKARSADYRETQAKAQAAQSSEGQEAQP
jgi:hypothetical protein